jgi:hypothetical protein
MADPATHVVDAQGGHFTSVGAAIRAASPGDRILVRPGVYEESLHIDQPLEIIGDRPVAQVEIRATDASVLVSSAPAGRVANLTFTQAKSADFLGVTIRQGRLEIEGCEISSPVVRGNVIRDSGRSGVYVHTEDRADGERVAAERRDDLLEQDGDGEHHAYRDEQRRQHRVNGAKSVPELEQHAERQGEAEHRRVEQQVDEQPDGERPRLEQGRLDQRCHQTNTARTGTAHTIMM